MIGVLLVTHDGVAEALARSVEHVLGPQEQLAFVGVNRTDELENLHARVRALVRELDQGQGVLIFTDLFGGTPANVAMSNVEPGRVEMLSGVNLPMLVRALSARQDGLAELVQRAVSGGHEGIIVASEMQAYYARCEAERLLRGPASGSTRNTPPNHPSY